MSKIFIGCILSFLPLVSFASDINVYKDGVNFPDIKITALSNNHFMDSGSVVNKDAINKIEVGMDKKQVELLLGRPHFVTGIFGVHTWNYVFKFKSSGGADMRCQYKIDFDDNMLVSDSYFNSEACASENMVYQNLFN
jgi:outer membrane protein assembly factor BamE (lipoprotein component of BamABCDE complex)